MKFSIIIPFYNASSYIPDCISNLKKQTYMNFEAIFINDGSTDNWESILTTNINLDHRFKVFSISKSGVSTARNVGISKASGEIVTFLDIDDKYDENFLMEFYQKSKIEHYDLCFCDYYEIYSNGSKVRKQIYPLLMDNVQIRLIERLLGKKKSNDNINVIFGSVWRCAFNKNFLLKNNIKFNENICIAEDLLFIINSILCTRDISFIDKYLYYYYVRANNTLNSYKKGKFESDIILHKELKKALLGNNILVKNDIYDRLSYNNYKMYTTSLSNISRCKSRKERNAEMKTIFLHFNSDNLVNARLLRKLSISEKIIFFLLKFKQKKITFFLFYIKEYFRIKRLK